MFERLKLWLQKWLGIYKVAMSARDTIRAQDDKIKAFEREIAKHTKEVSTLKHEFSQATGFIRALLDETQSGVDHHIRDNSWGVVCLRGKGQNYVQFFELSSELDARRFINALRQYGPRDPGRIIIDSTPGSENIFKRMMEDG